MINMLVAFIVCCGIVIALSAFVSIIIHFSNRDIMEEP